MVSWKNEMMEGQFDRVKKYESSLYSVSEYQNNVWTNKQIEQV